MPNASIPKDAAFQIINDELMLDGNPRLNLASFVTTWMEPECDKLMMDSIAKNYVDMDEYPVTTELQVCWEKFARYFEVDLKEVKLREGYYVMDPDKAVDMVDENTICVAAILGSTLTGEFEDVKRLNDLLTEKTRNWSINVSGHKYGLVYAGVGWNVWRSKEDLPDELIFHINYLGADQPTFTLNFSKGVQDIMENCMDNTKMVKEGLEATGRFEILSKDAGVPLVAFALKDNSQHTVFEISETLRRTSSKTAHVTAGNEVKSTADGHRAVEKITGYWKKQVDRKKTSGIC
ncbi:hypothetical protein GIB67_001909 [Kingdonia uniflora]|uniref:glutamate decarboxylase n=1 Tax=Kingdonia uniflora TaxID=39325 RepID=A0A7J7NU66_9MAGN|nr:hypothetical protein GIB67_001909 [Kingdonia uniflora]